MLRANFRDDVKPVASSNRQSRRVATLPERCAVRPLTSVRRHAPRLSARNLRRFLRNDGGATALEFGLVTAFMAIATLAAMSIFGSALTDFFAKLPLLFPA
nr:Flp family type IVb pilin [Methylobacterium sp. B4]